MTITLLLLITQKNVSIVDKCFLILVDEVVAKNDKKITSPLDYLMNSLVLVINFLTKTFPTLLFYSVLLP